MQQAVGQLVMFAGRFQRRAFDRVRLQGTNKGGNGLWPVFDPHVLSLRIDHDIEVEFTDINAERGFGVGLGFVCYLFLPSRYLEILLRLFRSIHVV